MKFKIFFCIFLMLFSSVEIQPKENHNLEMENHTFSYSLFWDIILPGYNFYRKEQLGWGSFFFICRIVSLYTAFAYHKQYLSYRSLENAAKIADLYYGLGYAYKDPVQGDYKTTKEFSLEAGRSASNRNVSIAVHILLMSIGLYKGYVDNWEEYLEKAPEYKSNNVQINYYNHSLTFSYTIPLDF